MTNVAKRFKPGQLVFRKRHVNGRGFRELNNPIDYQWNNIVDVSPNEMFVYLDIVYGNVLEDTLIPYAKVLTSEGVCYIQVSKLLKIEDRERDEELRLQGPSRPKD